MQDSILKPIPFEESFHQSEDSHDILVSKHLIPPPLMLLPKVIHNKPRSLLPMIPLPTFVGIIPNFQPLQKPQRQQNHEKDMFYNWIGEAFDNIVYKKYDQSSYMKIDNIDENWNIWACDITKLMSQKDNTQANLDGELKSFYTLKNPSDKTLVFESRFQSGNLSMASKVTEGEYNLLLQNDINTNGYSQWFFFKVSNTTQGKKTRFNILNFYKYSSLYRAGMRIVIYSVKESQVKNVSWHRGGENISYTQNGYSKSSLEYKPFYTLSWDYTFPHSDDQVYFAYNYPFTYSNLQNQIQKIESDGFMRQICQRHLLCKTAAGNRVDVLTITEDHPFQELDKSYIVITARIHPGQSVSSFVCNGILEFLLSNSEKARKLRQNFIFKIVPMINPDGVIHGNYRANISGYDLNRKWQNPSKHYHTQLYYLKRMILQLHEEKEILLFCDLHGHSKKKNSFIYGCHDVSDPAGGKLFPMLISKLFKGFSFKDCSFLVKEQREGTSRAVLSKQMTHQNIYTLESSFCGPEYEDIHFTVRHFEELGQKFCESLLICFDDKIKEMQIEAAMRNKSFFPHQQNSEDSIIQYQSLFDINQIEQKILEERVNSENSQGSEPENEYRTLLEERTIKKYLLLKGQRPSTSINSRITSLKRSFSKDLGTFKIRKSEFTIHKSISPVKRRQLYEPPNVEKIKFMSPTEKRDTQKREKHNIQPKLFTPGEFLTIGIDKRHYKSTSRLGIQNQPLFKKEQQLPATSRPHFKLTLTKNFEFKEDIGEKPPAPVFKNSQLKNFVKQEKNVRKEKRGSEFLIRKNNKVAYTDDKNSINLFKSVLSSLRKERN